MMRHAMETETTRTEATPLRSAWLMLGTIAASQALMLAVVVRAALGVETNALLAAFALAALVATVVGLGYGLAVWGAGMRASALRRVSAVQVVAGRVPVRPVVAALAFVAAAALIVA